MARLRGSTSEFNDSVNSEYISLTQASKLCEYSQEYLSLLARQKKLQAIKKGRNWETTKEWLAEYVSEHPADGATSLHKGVWKAAEPLEAVLAKKSKTGKKLGPRPVEAIETKPGAPVADEKVVNLDFTPEGLVIRQYNLGEGWKKLAGASVKEVPTLSAINPYDLAAITAGETSEKVLKPKIKWPKVAEPELHQTVKKFFSHAQRSNLFTRPVVAGFKRVALAALVALLAFGHLAYFTPASWAVVKNDVASISQTLSSVGNKLSQPVKIAFENVGQTFSANTFKSTSRTAAVISQRRENFKVTASSNDILIKTLAKAVDITEKTGASLVSLMNNFTKHSQIIATNARTSVTSGSGDLARATTATMATDLATAGAGLEPAVKLLTEAAENITRSLQKNSRGLLELAIGDLSEGALNPILSGLDDELKNKLTQYPLVAVGGNGELINLNTGATYPFVSITTEGNNLLLQPASGFYVAIGSGEAKYLNQFEAGQNPDARALLATGQVEIQGQTFIDVNSAEAALQLTQNGKGNLISGKNSAGKNIFSVSSGGGVVATSLNAGYISGNGLRIAGASDLHILNVAGDANLKGVLSVAGAATFAAAASFNGPIISNNTATFNNGAIINTGLAVNGPTILGGNLSVKGDGSFSGDARAQNVIATGDIRAGGTLSGQSLQINGTAIFNNLGVGYDLSVGRSLSVGGASFFEKDLTIGRTGGDVLTVKSNGKFQGPVTVSNTLNVTGATTLVNLTATGSTTLTQLLTPYQQVKTVAKTGGDYTTIAAALTAITDATAAKRYLVRVMPGIYDEAITMKEFVDIVGQGGAENTTISQTDADVVTAASNSLLSGMTITVGTATAARTAIVIGATSPSIKNVNISYDAGTAGTAVSVSTGAPILENIVLSGAALATGLSQTGAGGAIIRRSVITSTGDDINAAGGTIYSSYNRLLGASNNFTTAAAGTIQSSFDQYKTTSLAGAFQKYSFSSTPGGKAPALLLQPQGTTSWDTTTATYLGVNAATGFTGNLMDLQVAGASKFKVDYQGNATLTGATVAAGNISPATDNTYSLGTAALRWKDLALGPASVKIYSTTGTTGAGADYSLATFGFTGGNFNLTTSNAGAGVGGQINLTSAYPSGNTTSSAFNLTTSTDLAATDELFQLGDSAATFLTVLGNGNVGLGTAGPDRKLDILDSANPQLRLTYTDGSVYTDFQTTSSGGLTVTPSGTATGVNIASANTTGTGGNSSFSITGNSLTSGVGLSVASSSLTSGNLVSLASTSTAATSNTQTVLNVATSGANGTDTQTTYGGYFTNTHTGTASTNVAIYASASGGTNNYAAIFENGNVGIGTTAPGAKLEINDVGEDWIIRLGESFTGANGYTGILIKPEDDGAELRLQNNIGGAVDSRVVFAGSSGPLWILGNDISSLGIGLDGQTFGIYDALASQYRIVIGNTGNVGIGTTAPGAKLEVAQTITATGALKGIIYTGAVNTNQTLSTEIPSVTLTTAGRQWATGALTTQREVLITQPTYSFVGASTITDAATVGLAGAPIQGTNATLTNTHALLIQAGAVSTATNSYGLTVNAQTGATNNYAAAFMGGNVGIGDASPSASFVVGNGDLFQVAGATGNIITAGTLAVNGDSITADGATLTINAAGAIDLQDNVTADTLTIDTGALAVNTAAGLTSNQATLTINAAGNVDIQDALNADNITTDTGGISIAASQSYTGAGAVTLSSAATATLTVDSGTTGALNIGAGSNAKTITLGNTTGATAVNINAGSGGFALSSSGASSLNATGADLTIQTTTTGDIILNPASGNINIASGDDILALGANSNLGSAGVKFNTIYVDNVQATSLIGVIVGGATNSSDWTINTDNATADTEAMNLIFERGTETPNALMAWDITNKEFDFNSNLHITGTIASSVGLQLGGTTLDVTTDAGEALAIQPGTLTTDSGTGGALNLAGGNESGATSTGGAVNINAGTGTSTDGAINIGATTGSAVNISKTGITTTVNGALTATQLLTGNLGATITGAAVSLNVSSNFDTSLNTGTSTGAVAIGNALAGALTLSSGAASTWSTTGATANLIIRSGATTANTALTLDTVAVAGGSGGATLNTGNASAGVSGATNISTGTGTTGTGAVVVTTGNASAGAAGNITLDVGTSSAGNGSILIGTAARAQTITIGNATGGAITIGQATGSDLALNDAQWSITGLGVANFVSVGATSAGTGAFTTLTSTSHTTLATGAGTTNTFGSGASSINTIGSATTPGALTLHGATSLDNSFAQTGANTFSTGTGAVSLNGDTTIAAGKNLALASGAGTFTQTFTGTTTTASALTANSLTTGKALNLTSSNNSGADTAWQAAQFNLTNAQGTLAVSTGSIAGLDLQFTQNTSVAGNTETAARIALKQNDSASTDQTVASLLVLENNDTATGNQITVTDGLKITGTNITNGLNLSGTFGTNLITSSNFTVSQAGAITGVGLNAGTGLIQGTGGLTVTGTTNLNATGTAATNLGNSTGALVVASGGASSWTNTAGDLTIQTATSGTMAIDSAGILNLGTTNSTATNLGKAATTLTVNPTAWTATPTVSGLITATSGLTSNGAVTVQNNSNLTLSSGTGIFSQTYAPTTDATADAHSVILSAGGTGSTGTLRGLVITQNDTATTGVFDSLAYIQNLKTPETTTNGLLIEQNAAAGTMTNGLAITNTAGNLTTGIALTGTFTNSISAPSFTLSNAGLVTSVGLNAGSGLIQGTGGLTITGATVSLNASSNFDVNIATGTSTGDITLGGGTAGQLISINSDDWDITTAGAITGATYEGLTISTTTGSLTVTNGKTLTVSDSTTLATNAITLAGGEVITFSATNALSLLTTGATSVTLPTSGTLYGTATDSITSLQLLTSLSNETGTGAAVFATSPTLVTPALGTPSALVLTNATGLPAASVLAGTFGAGAYVMDTTLTVPKVIGGTATTSDLSLQTTSGVGADGADMHFLVGNNGATEAMTILNSGNVGIGTTAPASHLQIDGNMSAAAWTTDGLAFDVNAATYTDTSTAAAGTVAVRTANSFGAPTFASTNAITVTDAFTLYVPKPIAGTNTTITRANSAYFEGNVGIGTTSPVRLFHAYGTVRLGSTGNIYDNNAGHDFSSANNSAPVLTITGIGTADLLNVIDNTTEVFTILDGGNVGIGTTAPVTKLNVSGGATYTFAAAGLSFGDGDTGFYETSDDILGVRLAGSDMFQIRGGSDGDIYTGTPNGAVIKIGKTGNIPTYPIFIPDRDYVSGLSGGGSGAISLSTIGVSRLFIDATGNVGIGTTGPASHLQIDGNMSATAWTTDGIAFDVNAATYTDTSTAAAGTVAVRTANSFGAPTFASTNAITVTDAFTLYVPKPVAGTNTTITRANSAYFEGNVGIGTTSPTYLLSLGGTAARTIWMERNTTAATAGQGLTLSSGGAIAGTADLAGGDLTLQSGISTGTGSSAIHFYTATAAGTGTADNTQTEKMTILGSGNVGIGETNPTTGKLVINQTDAANLEALYINTEESTDGTSVFSIETDSTVGSGADTLHFKITADGSVYSDANVYSTPADVAEMYNDASGDLAPGEVVELVEGGNFLNGDKFGVERAVANSGNKVLGVISTKPGPVLGYDWKRLDILAQQKPVALAGRVPVKIAASSLAIAAGDYLVVSAEAGRAQKAVSAGWAIAKALESWQPNSGADSIMALMSQGWFDPQNPDLSVSGKLSVGNDLSLGGLATIGGKLSVGNDFSLGGLATIGGGLLVGSDFSLNGAASLSGGLSVVGASDFTGDVNLQGKVSLGSQLSVGNLKLNSAGLDFGGTQLTTVGLDFGTASLNSNSLNFGSTILNQSGLDFGGGSQVMTSGQNLNFMSVGNVGIGTAGPSYKLDVAGEVNASGLRLNGLDINSVGALSNVAYLSVGNNFSGNNIFNGQNNFNGSLEVMDNAGGNLLIANSATNEVKVNSDLYVSGAVYANTGAGNAAAGVGGAGDVAEFVDIAIFEKTEAGDLLVAYEEGSQVFEKTKVANAPSIAGVVSTAPTIYAGYAVTTHNAKMALVGRVLVKVSTENGAIKPGDYLTSSSVPGVAMKATITGVGVIGQALEPFGDIASVIPAQAGIYSPTQNSEFSIQNSIMVLVQPGRFTPAIGESTKLVNNSSEIALQIAQNGDGDLLSMLGGGTEVVAVSKDGSAGFKGSVSIGALHNTDAKNGDLLVSRSVMIATEETSVDALGQIQKKILDKAVAQTFDALSDIPAGSVVALDSNDVGLVSMVSDIASDKLVGVVTAGAGVEMGVVPTTNKQQTTYNPASSSVTPNGTSSVIPLENGIQTDTKTDASIHNSELITHNSQVKVATSGVVKVKVNTANGDIKVGDILTSSAIAGYAEKAGVNAVNTLGIALKPFACAAQQPTDNTQQTTVIPSTSSVIPLENGIQTDAKINASQCTGEILMLLQVKSSKPMPYNLANSSTEEMLANLGKLAVVAASGSETAVSVASDVVGASPKIPVEEWVQFKGKVAIADELIVGKLAILNEVQILKNLKVLGDIRLAGDLQIDGAMTVKFFEAEANSLQVGDAVAIAGDKLVRRAGANDSAYKPAIGLVASISLEEGGRRVIEVAISGVVRNLKDLQPGAVYFLSQNDSQLSTQAIDSLLAQVDQIANGSAKTYNLEPNTSPLIDNGTVARGLTLKVTDAEGEMVQVLGVARSANEFVIMPSLQVAVVGKDGSVANLFNSTFWNAIATSSTNNSQLTTTNISTSESTTSQPATSEPNPSNLTPITSSTSPLDSTNPLTSVSGVTNGSSTSTSASTAPIATDSTSSTSTSTSTSFPTTPPTDATTSTSAISPLSIPSEPILTAPVSAATTESISVSAATTTDTLSSPATPIATPTPTPTSPTISTSPASSPVPVPSPVPVTSTSDTSPSPAS